jgi:hypothetical protein
MPRVFLDMEEPVSARNWLAIARNTPDSLPGCVGLQSEEASARSQRAVTTNGTHLLKMIILYMDQIRPKRQSPTASLLGRWLLRVDFHGCWVAVFGEV